MRKASEMVDDLAKKNAESVAMSATMRKFLKVTFVQDEALAIFANRLTLEVASHLLRNG